ncbi:MAG: cysteine hydrolase [Lysobacteraceae bacterium]|nr:MAG: cysteine hydrolase [Xanthomonadaceae bacterium]
MAKRKDIDHHAPRSALLVVDMINLFDFEGGAVLRRDAERVAPAIARLKQRFHAAGAPVIHVNDNFMDWRADFRELVAVCSQPSSPGAAIARALAPTPEDYYILKPKHSAFLATPLAVLLAKLGVQRLVLTGLAADACILITAQEANMREYEVCIPSDGVAAQSQARRNRALELARASFGADIRPCSRVRPG